MVERFPHGRLRQRRSRRRVPGAADHDAAAHDHDAARDHYDGSAATTDARRPRYARRRPIPRRRRTTPPPTDAAPPTDDATTPTTQVEGTTIVVTTTTPKHATTTTRRATVTTADEQGGGFPTTSTKPGAGAKELPFTGSSTTYVMFFGLCVITAGGASLLHRRSVMPLHTGAATPADVRRRLERKRRALSVYLPRSEPAARARGSCLARRRDPRDCRACRPMSSPARTRTRPTSLHSR